MTKSELQFANNTSETLCICIFDARLFFFHLTRPCPYHFKKFLPGSNQRLSAGFRMSMPNVLFRAALTNTTSSYVVCEQAPSTVL